MTIFDAIGFFGGIALFCLAQGVFWLIRSQRREREDALRRRLMVVAEEVDLSITRDLRGELTGALGELKSMQQLNTYLMQSGVGMSLRAFLFLAVALVSGMFLLTLLLTAAVASGILMALITGLVLYIVISGKRTNRLNAIDAQLPKALELMMIGLRAGHTLEDTIRFASEELQPPLSLELGRCAEEYAMGRPIEAALTNMAQRLSPCKALRVFVESVLVLKQTGGNLIEIIEQIIDSLRAQAAFEARYRALTSEGRTSGIILGALPVLVLAVVMLVQPGYLGMLLLDNAGRVVIMIAAGQWSLGIFWLWRLIKPTV